MNKKVADYVVATFYADQEPPIDVVGAIKGANQYNSEITDDGHLVVTVSSTAGNIIGTYTVDVWGDYTAPSTSAGSIKAHYYTVASSDKPVQILSNDSYETVTFSVTGPISGVEVTVPTSGVHTVSAGSAQIYAPLAKQDVSVTKEVTTAYTGDKTPVIESKTFDSAAFKEAIIAALPKDSKANPVTYVQGVAKTYLNGINAAGDTIYKDINTVLGGTSVTGLSVTTDWDEATDDANTTEKKEGVFTLTLTGDGYKFGTYKMTGSMTLTFKKASRALTSDAKVVSLAGDYTIGGTFKCTGDYPVEIAIDSAFPITGTCTDGTVTLKEAAPKSGVASIVGTKDYGSFSSGRMTIEGTTKTI